MMYKPITLLLVLLALPLLAQQIVINATPKSQVTSSSKETKREVLNNSKQNEFRLLITKQNGKYYWATRDNRELFYTVSGAFHIFIEAGGAGYITVFDQSVLPESMRDPGADIQYKEHIRAFMGDITYWGSAEKFDP